MAQMLARMERDGLIKRAPDPDDGRSSRITLTEAAEARLPDAVAALLRGNHEVLRNFTDEEAGLLVALLTRLIANLDRVASVEMTPSTPIRHVPPEPSVSNDSALGPDGTVESSKTTEMPSTVPFG
jgi:hypothetical protein